MISNPKKSPVIGALKVAEIPAAAPHATMMRSRVSDMRTHWPNVEAAADPIWTIGPSAPPIRRRRCKWPRQTPLRRSPGADPPTVLRHGQHDLGHPVAGVPRREALDERSVDEPAEDRDQEQEPDPQPGQMEAADPALLSELLVTGGQPGEREDSAIETPPHRGRRPLRPRAP